MSFVVKYIVNCAVCKSKRMFCRSPTKRVSVTNIQIQTQPQVSNDDDNIYLPTNQEVTNSYATYLLQKHFSK